MENKRLNQLLKQRALIEEHLIWLDAEIDAVQGTSASTVASGVPANRLQSIEEPFKIKAILPPIEDPDPNLVVSDIFDELGPETGNSANVARRGCMGVFAFAILALAALVVWIYIKY